MAATRTARLADAFFQSPQSAIEIARNGHQCSLALFARAGAGPVIERLPRQVTVGPLESESSSSVESSNLLGALLTAFAEQLPLSQGALAQKRRQRWRIVRVALITLAVAVPLGIAVFWLAVLLSVRR
jgi:hypothetical protein